ncbi:MAG: gliding motility-associated ABC transporter substrate-binding protein GldG [Bacteroidia bacterium]|jgi:gliding-associated putative ABC transporter substrate-binding component GldG|nr:gliding motility-associated ABC transporter substrate-binding protein GldG [Bacteroidia bacterium]
MKKTNKRLQSYLNLLTVLIMLIIANTLGNIYYQRLDLTEEKRFTLSETSKRLCGKLDEKLYIKLFLDGEMSAKFKRLKLEIRDLTLEFREASGQQIELEIINPFDDVKEGEMEKMLQGYVEKGINPVRDIDRENADETRIKYLLPGAEIFYGNKRASINFFEYDVALSPDENISKAIDNIEYELANGIRQVSTDKSKSIVVADGSGEMIGADVSSFARELTKYYNISALNMNFSDPNAAAPWAEQIKQNPENADQVFINGLHRRLNLNDLLIIVKPLQDYSNQELYLIDQFIMSGGRVMWMIDPVHIEIDSFRNYKQVLALNRDIENISASLFHYGVGLKNTLLTDLKCNRIPIPASGRMELVDFPYFPIFGDNESSHVITKNIGSVWAQFPATLEPKVRPELDIIPLLTSTPYTKVITAPAPIDLESVYMQMRSAEYRESMKNGEHISAVLMEGMFKSRYKFMKKYSDVPYLEKGKSKMIVIADGDIIRNPVDKNGRGYPTGYDRISQFTFANKKFLLNCIDYLIDDNGLIEIRSKERTVRLLDPEKSKSEKTYWQWFSMLMPIALMIILGIVNYFIRKRRYT